MKKIFPSWLEIKDSGKVDSFEDLGLENILKNIYGSAPDHEENYETEQYKLVTGMIKNWFEGFERDSASIKKKQDILSYFINNPDIAKEIVETKHKDNRGDSKWINRFVFADYGGLMRYRWGSPSDTKEIIKDNSLEKEISHFKEHHNWLSNILAKNTNKGNKEYIDLVNGLSSVKNEIKMELESENPTYIIESSVKVYNVKDAFGLHFNYDPIVTVLSEDGNKITKTGVKWSHDIIPSDLNNFAEKLGRGTHQLRAVLNDGKFEGTIESKSGKVKTFSLYDTEKNALPELINSETNHVMLAHLGNIVNDYQDMFNELKAISTVALYFNKIKEKGYDISFPEIAKEGNDRDIKLVNFVHPYFAYTKKKGEGITNSVNLTEEKNMMIITGKYASGKTTLIEAMGLDQIFFQAGAPVIASESAMKVKQNIYTQIPKEGTIGSGSKHAEDSIRSREVIALLTKHDLYIGDEPYKATFNGDGTILSNMFYENLVTIGSTSLLTTQQSDSVQYVSTHDQYGKHILPIKPSDSIKFKMDPGISFKYYALQTAEELGLTEERLQKLD
jgi:DNA mismatch repair ATPase MutS